MSPALPWKSRMAPRISRCWKPLSTAVCLAVPRIPLRSAAMPRSLAAGVPLAWALAFPLGLGVRGLWWGLTVSLTVVAVVESLLFLRGGWRRLAPIGRAMVDGPASRA